jgi:hypothetical protein
VCADSGATEKSRFDIMERGKFWLLFDDASVCFIVEGWPTHIPFIEFDLELFGAGEDSLLHLVGSAYEQEAVSLLSC